MPDKTFLLSELLVPELTSELAKTRRSLERAPEAQAAFKPHEKSMTLLQLCNHLGTVSCLPGSVLTVDAVELGSPTDPRRIFRETSIPAILPLFDELAARSIETLRTIDDAGFHTPWQATREGKVLFSGNKYSALRNIAINHMIHHRAQLGVYLRHLDVPVPATFGPSADEKS